MFLSQLSKLVNIIKEFDIQSYFSIKFTTCDNENDNKTYIKTITLNPKNDKHHIDSTNKNTSKSILNTDERDEIALTIMNLMDSYLDKNPLEVSSYHFDNNIQEYVIGNLFIGLKDFYDPDILQDTLIDIYHQTCKIYFSKYYPKRSYDSSFIRKPPNIETTRQKILYIENKPQPEQKSKEWYIFRHNLITASSAWKIFKSQSTINQIILEKCKSIDVGKYDIVNTSTPMHHGNKYEDVSIMFYEYKYNTKIRDYGCIQHDTYKFLGASPDGINVDPKSDLYGRMLEIKNPTSREITGIPKEDYWIQMQLQMETCDLNECDFLETSFKEYESEEDFMNDGTFTYSSNDELKGTMVYFMKDGKPIYEYMPLYISTDEYKLWYDNVMEKHANLSWISNIYWRLEKYSCILVLRNKEWFKHAVPHIGNVWSIITKEKVDGFEHRMPKKMKPRLRSNSEQADSGNLSSGLHISLLNVILNDTMNTDTSKNETLNEKIQHTHTLSKSGCIINTDNLHNQIIYIDTGFEIQSTLESDISNSDIGFVGTD
jgi:putative phage-type endonuclease